MCWASDRAASERVTGFGDKLLILPGYIKASDGYESARPFALFFVYFPR
jgi:hypothetical protein